MSARLSNETVEAGGGGEVDRYGAWGGEGDPRSGEGIGLLKPEGRVGPEEEPIATEVSEFEARGRKPLEAQMKADVRAGRALLMDLDRGDVEAGYQRVDSGSAVDCVLAVLA